MKQKIILQLYGIYIRDINEDISEAADVIDKYATSLDIKIGESVLFQTKRNSNKGPIKYFTESFAAIVSDNYSLLEVSVDVNVEILKCLGPFSKPYPTRKGSIFLGQAIQNINQPTAIAIQLRISPDAESTELATSKYSQGSFHMIGHLLTDSTCIGDSISASETVRAKEDTLKLYFSCADRAIEDFYCCVQQVSASLERFPGRMYITIDAIYFHGHLFGRTQTFHIPFAGVQLFLNNSDGSKNIRISNADNEYVFDWFFELESCYRLLQSCAEAAGSNSSPSPSFSKADVNGALAAKQQQDGLDLLADANGSLMSAEEMFLRDCEILRNDKHELPAVNISDSLSDFCALFLNDNCSFSLKRYHDRLSDRAVASTAWISVPGKGCPVIESIRETKVSRNVSFLGLSTSPSQLSRLASIQRLRRYGDHAAILSTSVRFEDVPSCDTFFTEEHLLIIADGNSLTIIAVLGLVFNQFSHLRSLIEPKLLEDRCQWLRSYLEYIKHISDAHVKRRAVANKEYSGLRSQPSQSPKLDPPSHLKIASPSFSSPSTSMANPTVGVSALFPAVLSQEGKAQTPYAGVTAISPVILIAPSTTMISASPTRKINFTSESSAENIELRPSNGASSSSLLSASSSTQGLGDAKESAVVFETEIDVAKAPPSTNSTSSSSSSTQMNDPASRDTAIVKAYRKDNSVCLLCGISGRKTEPVYYSIALSKKQIIGMLLIVLAVLFVSLFYVNNKTTRLEKKIDNIERLLSQLILPDVMKNSKSAF